MPDNFNTYGRVSSALPNSLIKSAVGSSPVLVDEIRLRTALRLHERLREIEPTRFGEISDSKLRAIAEAFKRATLALERGSEDRKVDVHARTTLAIALMESN